MPKHIGIPQPDPSTKLWADAAPPANSLYKFLRYKGNSSNTISMKTNGVSASGKTFAYIVPTNRRAVIERANINILDGSVDPVDFGGIAGSLGTGVKVEIWDSKGTVLRDYCDGEPIKQNADWTGLAGVDVMHVTATGDDHLPIRWTLSKAGHGVRMNAGESFVMTVQDNLGALAYFNVMLQGSEFTV